VSDTGQSAACASQDDRNLTSIADVIEDPARSAHLRQLTEAGLIRVRVQGRHRYHEIVNPEVDTVLEAIAQIAPPAPVRSVRQEQAACALSDARTCYDHLAGRRGVELRDRLLSVGALRRLDDRDHELTDRGQDLVERLGIDLAVLQASRRVFARSCVDWTDRRVHLAGALPATITSAFLARGWLTRGPGRTLRVAPGFDGNVEKWLAT